MRRLLAGAAVLAVAGVAGVATGQSGPSGERVCPNGSDAVIRKGELTYIAKPSELDQIVAHAGSGELLLASDGTTLMRSTDGGCSWSEGSFEFPLKGTGVEGLPAVSRLLIPEGSSSALAVVDGIGKAALTRIYRSEDLGKTWTEGAGLPPVEGVRQLVSAPDDAKVVYAALDVNDAASQGGLLYASVDGGATWSQRSTGEQISSLAVDPTRATELWVTRAGGALQTSTDGGVTFTGVELPARPQPLDPENPTTVNEDEQDPGPARQVAVWHTRPSPPVIVVQRAPTRDADILQTVGSLDGGNTWFDMGAAGLGPASGLLFGNGDSQLYAASGSDSTAHDGPGLLSFEPGSYQWEDIDTMDLISLKDPHPAREQLGPRSGRTIYLRQDLNRGGTPDALVRYQPPPPGPVSVIGRRDCGQGEFKPAKVRQDPIGFSPNRLELKLQPGVSTRAELKADIPAVPTPMDVYFLIDNSDSMEPAINGLFCSIEHIMRALPQKGIDTHFGFGVYNDLFETGNQTSYRRYVDVEEPSERIRSQLRLLTTLGGDHEPMRTALFQTATGAGLQTQIANGGLAGKRDVAPGQQANFRKDTVKVVMLMADEPYEDSANEGEPTREEAARAIVDKNAQVIGIRVVPFASEQIPNPNDNDHTPVRLLQLQQQLQWFATSTKSLAPEGGVDCDGGGSPDVPAGQPFVCSIDEQGIRGAIDDTLISVLRAVRDEKDVKIVPAKTGGLDVRVEGGAADKVDVKKPSSLAGTAVITCTADQVGKAFDLRFDVMVGGDKKGTLEGVARCGDVPVAAPVVPPPPRVKAPAPAQAPQGAPQPAPVTQTPAQIAQAPLPAPVAQPAPQVAAAAAPPPPPPAPATAGTVPAQAPAPSTAAAPAPGQAAGAMTEQREHPPQVAVVRTDGESTAPLRTAGEHSAVRGERRGEYSMSAVRAAPVRSDFTFAASREREVVPLPALLTLGVGFVGGMGALTVAGARRRRPGPAVERIR